MTGSPIRSVAMVLGILWAFLPLPAHAASPESEMYYSEGRAALSRHANSEALALFRKSIAEDAQNLEARYYLGLLYSGNIKTYSLAEEELLELPDRAMRQKAGGRDDLIYRAGVALGKLYAKSGRNLQAIRLVRNVIAAAPPSVQMDEAYTLLGLSLYYERMYEEAILELRRALKINPSNMAATFNLKTIRTRLEHFNAARIYSRTGDHLGAIEEYRQTIALDPRFVDARYRLGLELMLVGENSEALKELRRAESINGNYTKLHEIAYGKGLAYRDLGQVEEARKQFEQVVQKKPGFAPAYNEIGKLHMERKEFAQAMQRFAEAIAIDPTDEYAKNLQAAMSRAAAP